ncbi:hypothetical protein ACWCPP_29955, partial [Streptomyces sp. NPDC002287]
VFIYVVLFTFLFCPRTKVGRPGGDGANPGAVCGGTEDPFFRQPLWLQTRCAGRTLWAYNEEHIEALTAYVGARLRERYSSPTMAMFARLPAWMKAAKHRDEVVAGLATLGNLAQLSAPAARSDTAYARGDRPRHHGSVLFRGGPYWGTAVEPHCQRGMPESRHA